MPQSSRTPPIFPRTERVLAESPATLRESCSNAQGAGNFDLSNVRKKSTQRPYDEWKSKSPAPCVFLRGVSRALSKEVHEACDCKVWLLSSSIWYGFCRGPFSVIFWKNPLDPKIGGIFEGSADTSAKNLRRQSSRASPIFPRTERVLAESSATLRESCSTEMKRIWPFCPRPTLKHRRR